MAKQIILNVNLTFSVPDDYVVTGNECVDKRSNGIIRLEPDNNEALANADGMRPIRCDTLMVINEHGEEFV